MTRGQRGRLFDLFALGASAVVHFPGLLIGPSLDASVFSVVGWRIAGGALPYVDVWDHKPPGTYLINAGAVLLPGDAQWLTIWVCSVLAMAFMAVVAARVVGQFASDTVGGWVGVATALIGGQYLLTLGGGLTEPFAGALAVGAFAWALSARSTPSWLLIGSVLGLSLLMSPQLAPAVLGVAVVAMLRGGGEVRVIGLIAAGLGAVVGGAVVALAVTGALEAATDGVIVYNEAYRAASGLDARRWSLVPWTVLATLPLLAPALVGVTRLRAHRAAHPAGLGAVMWIIAGIGLCVVQDRFYAHYAVGLIFPVAVLAGVGVLDVSLTAPFRRGWLVPALVGLLTVVVALPISFLGAVQEAAQWTASNHRTAVVGTSVRALSRSESTILVWGNEPWLYRTSGRIPATRFVYLLPLVTPEYATPRVISDLARMLEAMPPQLVVDAGSLEPGEPGFPELLITRPSASDGRDADLLDPLRDFIQRRYELATIVEGWPIYRLKDQ